MVRTFSITLSALAILAFAAPLAAQPNQGTWLDKNGALVVPPLGRHGNQAANGRIYLWSGVNWSVNPGTIQTQTFEYDPVANTMTTLASAVPGLRHHFAHGVVNVGGTNWIYMMGGMTTSTLPGGLPASVPTFRFNCTTKTWDLTSHPSIPTTRYRCTGVVENNLIRVLGGLNAAGASLGTHEVYDTNINNWITPGAAMPQAVAGPYVGFVNGKIVSAGGLNFPAGNASNQIDEYEIASGIWSPATAFMNVAISDGGSVAFANRLFLVCGLQNGVGGTISGFVREYHSASRTVFNRPDCPVVGYYAPAAMLNNKFYSIGNEFPPAAQERLWEYTPPQFGPNVPTAGYQKSLNGPQVPGGGSVGGTVVFGATITDPDTIDQVRIEVEVRTFPDNVFPIASKFVGVPTGVGAMRPQSGAPVEVIHPPLTNGAYMWRYRAVDPYGDVTAWQNFNLPDDMDFVVNQSIVFDNEDNASGDAPGPGCSAVPQVSSLGMLLGLAVMAFGLRRRK